MSAARDDFVSFVQQVVVLVQGDCKLLLFTEAASTNLWFVGYVVPIFRPFDAVIAALLLDAPYLFREFRFFAIFFMRKRLCVIPEPTLPLCGANSLVHFDAVISQITR